METTRMRIWRWWRGLAWVGTAIAALYLVYDFEFWWRIAEGAPQQAAAAARSAFYVVVLYVLARANDAILSLDYDHIRRREAAKSRVATPANIDRAA